GLFVLVLRRLERPIVEQRSAYDVLARNKTPEPRVKTIVAIVAHHEKLTGWNNRVPVCNMAWKLIRPCIGSASVGITVTLGGNGRKLIKERGVIRSRCRLSVRKR